MKIWKINDDYNFADEFNRITNWVNWCCEILKIDLSNYTRLRTNWGTSLPYLVEENIIDLNDYNELKSAINEIEFNLFGTRTLQIDERTIWDVDRANELERAIDLVVSYLSELQFKYQVCGASISGNGQKLNGVI